MEIRYSDHNYKKLMSELKALITFGAVALWDKRANEELDGMRAVIERLQADIDEQQRALDQAREEHNRKSALARMFSSPKDEQKLLQTIQEDQASLSQLEGLADELQEAIDFTPNSKDEQEVLLKELNFQKRELAAEKKEISLKMREVRAEARQQSAKAGMRLGGLMYSSKLAASQRRSIRYKKEAELRPHEDEMAAIERQILQLDKDILWAQRFS